MRADTELTPAMIINNVIAIFRKELQGYFASPMAYLVSAVFWLLSGLFFTIMLLGPEGIIQQIAIREQQGLPTNIDVAYRFLTDFMGVIGSLILFILPMLSMGLYTEERKRGTIELLATSPITNWVVAVGKLLGVVTFFGAMMVPLVIYETIAFSHADPPIQPAVPLLAHAGLILLAASILSIAMFISSLTESTILSAILTFSLILLLWIVDAIGESMGGWVGDALTHLSLLKHYDNLIKGIFDSSSLILFVSYIILGVFLTAQSIESLRFGRS